MKKPLNEIVAKNIFRLLEHLGETSMSAKKLTKLDQKTVWNMANAEHCNPTIRNIEKLANGLGVHPAFLLIDSALDQSIPDKQTIELMERILHLSPKARGQVAEFIEMWERPNNGQ